MPVESIVVSVGVVVAFTLIIVFNAQLLTTLVQRGRAPRYTASVVLVLLTVAAIAGGVALGDRGNGLGELSYLLAGVTGIGAAVALAAVRFPYLAPALKMGIAYPLSNRFRTGMTIAMFSLIVFSLATVGPAIVGSMNRGDVYVTATFMLVLAATLIIGNIIADILLALLDPRVRLGEGAP